MKELEAKVAELTKENGRLKNELKFTKDTERWVCLIFLMHSYRIIDVPKVFFITFRRAAGEQINVLRKTLDMLQAKNDQVGSELASY